jgi:DNA-binding NtrC family response regulator
MKIKVMIVEDESQTREMLLDYFTNGLGCEVVALADAKSAVTALNSFKPDLILTDYDMPGTNGLDLIRDVKALIPHVTIVMTTACQKIETAVEAMKRGAEDFLTKPFNLYQLDLMIQKVCVKKENIKTLEQIEQEHIESVIAQTGSVNAAALKLGINPSTIWRKRKKASA